MAKAKQKRPRQKPLGGMEDARIKELDDIAGDYVEIRDERIQLSQREADLKAKTKGLMAKHGKKLYRHEGIEIRLIAGEEDVKVKVKKPKGEDD